MFQPTPPPVILGVGFVCGGWGDLCLQQLLYKSQTTVKEVDSVELVWDEQAWDESCKQHLIHLLSAEFRLNSGFTGFIFSSL